MGLKTYHITDLFKCSWAELTAKEISIVVELKMNMMKARQEKDFALAGHYGIMILRTLRKKKDVVAKFNEAQAVDCVNDLKFIHEPWYIFPTLNLPEESCFYNPPTHLKNHTLGQLYWMDSLFSKFLITSAKRPDASKVFINEMIGVIYCPPDKFDDKLITDRGLMIEKITDNFERSTIIHTYANLKEFIMDNFPMTFPAGEEVSDQTPFKKAPVDSEPMWQDILFDLSESNAYMGMDRTKAAPMFEALNYLEKKHKEATKQKS